MLIVDNHVWIYAFTMLNTGTCSTTTTAMMVAYNKKRMQFMTARYAVAKETISNHVWDHQRENDASKTSLNHINSVSRLEIVWFVLTLDTMIARTVPYLVSSLTILSDTRGNCMQWQQSLEHSHWCRWWWWMMMMLMYYRRPTEILTYLLWISNEFIHFISHWNTNKS